MNVISAFKKILCNDNNDHKRMRCNLVLIQITYFYVRNDICFNLGQYVYVLYKKFLPRHTVRLHFILNKTKV